jgi:hypothetical protein
MRFLFSIIFFVICAGVFAQEIKVFRMERNSPEHVARIIRQLLDFSHRERLERIWLQYYITGELEPLPSMPTVSHESYSGSIVVRGTDDVISQMGVLLPILDSPRMHDFEFVTYTPRYAPVYDLASLLSQLGVYVTSDQRTNKIIAYSDRHSLLALLIQELDVPDFQKHREGFLMELNGDVTYKAQLLRQILRLGPAR